MATKVLLDRGVPDLAALGASAPEDLLGTGTALVGEPDAERLEGGAGAESWRVPLPGTLRGRPRGAGTGWIVVRRYGRAPLRARMSARFTHPRSDSLASREWNLLCALRAAGVVTPEPLAVAWEEHPLFAPRSAVVTRALDGAVPAPDWFAGTTDVTRRRRACTALGLTVARLGAAGFDLALAPTHLFVLEDEDAARPDTGPDACGLERVLAARGASRVDLGRELRWRRLPEVVVAEVRGGRRRARDTTARLLARLARVPEAGALSSAERRRVARAAGRSSVERRALLAIGT